MLAAALWSRPVFDGFIVALVPVGLVVDDSQDLDEAEGGSQPPQGHLLVRVDLGHDPSRLPPRRLIAAGAQVQVDPTALELEVTDGSRGIIVASTDESARL